MTAETGPIFSHKKCFRKINKMEPIFAAVRVDLRIIPSMQILTDFCKLGFLWISEQCQRILKSKKIIERATNPYSCQVCWISFDSWWQPENIFPNFQISNKSRVLLRDHFRFSWKQRCFPHRLGRFLDISKVHKNLLDIPILHRRESPKSFLKSARVFF